MKKNKNIVVWSNHPNPPLDSVMHCRYPLENTLISLRYSLKHPPLASWLKRYHNLIGECVLISPVYFHTTHNDCLIGQCGTNMGLNEGQGRWYFDKVREFFKDEGIKLHYHSPTLWVGQLNEPISINSFSPSYLLSKSILPYLENLGDDMNWQKKITEGQMLLKSLNPPMKNNDYNPNGLWFWGQGELSMRKYIIVSDDANMIRLKEVWPLLTIQDNFEKTNFGESENILVTNYTHEKLKIIEKESRSFSCNWYWNNITYHQPAKRWWMLKRKRV